MSRLKKKYINILPSKKITKSQSKLSRQHKKFYVQEFMRVFPLSWKMKILNRLMNNRGEEVQHGNISKFKKLQYKRRILRQITMHLKEKSKKNLFVETNKQTKMETPFIALQKESHGIINNKKTTKEKKGIKLRPTNALLYKYIRLLQQFDDVSKQKAIMNIPPFIPSKKNWKHDSENSRIIQKKNKNNTYFANAMMQQAYSQSELILSLSYVPGNVFVVRATKGVSNYRYIATQMLKSIYGLSSFLSLKILYQKSGALYGSTNTWSFLHSLESLKINTWLKMGFCKSIKEARSFFKHRQIFCYGVDETNSKQKVTAGALMQRDLPLYTGVFHQITSRQSSLIPFEEDSLQFLVPSRNPELLPMINDAKLKKKERFKTLLAAYATLPAFHAILESNNKNIQVNSSPMELPFPWVSRKSNVNNYQTFLGTNMSSFFFFPFIIIKKNVRFY